MRRTSAGFEQQLDEIGGLVTRPHRVAQIALRSAGAGAGITEQLLELVDDEQQCGAAETLDLVQHFRDPEARPQIEFNSFAPGRGNGGGLVLREFRQGIGEPRQRRAAGTHFLEPPFASAGIVALVRQQRQQARAHQRGLAAAGAADDGDEPALNDQPIERIGLRLAPEEEITIFEGKRSEPGKRPIARERRSRLRAHALLWSVPGISGSSSSGDGRSLSVRSSGMSISLGGNTRLTYFLRLPAGGPAITARYANRAVRPRPCQSRNSLECARTQASEAVAQHKATASHSARFLR